MARRRSLFEMLTVLGPGFAVAATGVGAGDVVAAAVSGAQFGTVILWAAVVGALLKFALNDGIARWQLATGSTLLQGWHRHLHRSVLVVFLVYLLVWTVMVAAALMSACGLAAHAFVPIVPIWAWGVIHSLAAAVLVYAGRYHLFERVMKVFIALMFVTVVISAVLIKPDLSELAAGVVIPRVPTGGGKFLLGVIGGVGGSVTLLSYGYWMRERGWTSPADRGDARLDLVAAYLLTGVFGVAIMVVGAGVEPSLITGSAMAVEIANRIGLMAGAYGKWIFLIGFWGAVFTSMLGVWQGVPYIFADTVELLRGEDASQVKTSSPAYRGYLLFIAVLPMLLLTVDRPVWIVLIYSMAGALFMPFLAVTLLMLNNRFDWMGALKNGPGVNLLLVLALLLFAYLFIGELVDIL